MELLSMAEVLKYVLSSYQPLKEEDFTEKESSDKMEGLLVVQHHKVNVYIMILQLVVLCQVRSDQQSPSCIRVDEVVYPRGCAKSEVGLSLPW